LLYKFTVGAVKHVCMYGKVTFTDDSLERSGEEYALLKGKSSV